MDEDETDDAALLAAWRAGDRRAGNRFVDRHFAAVYRFSRRRLPDAASAKDITQRVFLACLEASERIESTTRMRVYVLGIARNLVLRLFRDANRQARDGALEASVVSPSRVAAEREEQALLRAAMAALPDDLRNTLELHYWDELTTAEIGVLLGVAPGTIKWRLSRGRALLRQRIAEMSATRELRDSTLQRLDHWARQAGASDDETEAPERG